MVSCAERQSSSPPSAGKASLEKTNWYVASKEPLTFCPKGYSLPKSERSYTVGEYVYLSDRKTRFFIPIGKDGARCRKEALAVRESSLTTEDKMRRRTYNTVEVVSGLLLRLSMFGLAAGAAAGGSPSEALMEAAFTPYD